MRPEYGFSYGIRGKHYRTYQQGTNIVLLTPDIVEIFKDSEAVNHTLRIWINLASDGLKRNITKNLSKT
jgi:hypothetical protein